ncbi:GNAT family N-acetyltransferase, partial [Micromonospora sp. WP24]|uniref:GNAT family N-acetyltransferase n=1 Tax=Micromonospora sp. WP24 TaxID=2604469 RepID=UPI0011D85D34
MPSSTGPGSSGPLRLAVVRASDEDAVQAAIRLGNMARSTLGHLAFAAYYDAAAKDTLLMAYSDDRPVGYALYDLARRRVRLTHLCVDPAFQGRGIARLLVDEISKRHSDYLGIAASCRHSYNLGPMWISLEFTNIGERPGRGKDAAPLVDWWRDHHHPNLFTADIDTVLVRAGIDLNILRDITEANRPDADDSRSLVAPHLIGRLELVRTAALDAEIDQMAGDLRGRCARRAQPFASVRAASGEVKQLTERILEQVRQIDPTYPSNENDEFDLRHVAHAAAAQLKVFITKDAHLTQVLGPAATRFGLRVLRPADVVVHIDELARAESYRPVDLLDTGYAQRLVGSGRDSDLLPLTNSSTGERPKQLLKVLKQLAINGHDRVGIYSPTGAIVAAYGLIEADNSLHVPLLRVINRPLGDTLARQLLFLLRQHARDTGKRILRITDTSMSAQVRSAALTDGFREADPDLFTYVLPVVGDAAEVEHHAVKAARQAGVSEPAPLGSGMPAVVAAELEHAWWPAKIVDSDLPTYLVPIQQAYSADLLGVPRGLLPRHELLGLNREHVYYRSPGGIRLHAPARLLWYMSTGGSTVAQPAAI